uniref:Proteasome subunit beta n=1 Tax=Fibrocapsa japonica TaxID=94617 RepID=A0A7S2XZZ5_9STRA|eukprot:CAMPEP_0113942934 /NCGR_PEP_ID=MMETSP1339-20121228/14961_1 /TAXON_ID=94617 /ORGANISM="Fibrocapsa japonica" /LENGTH=202 /DNA_ID=CAMNT_0000947625 /DNA_START=102 /DNA_END=710 /DNA_ORIENTATION=- /assembly_acc=CAM_ASM_000762
MDTVVGLVGNGFVLVAADAMSGRSILIFKDDYDKVKEMDPNKLLGLAGPQADCENFSEYIQKNMELYRLNNNGLTLGTHAAANFIRGEMAYALRRGPYQCNMLLGGVDPPAKGSTDSEPAKPQLFFIDYLASCHPVNFGCHGYGSSFLLSILDRCWKEDLTQEEAIDIVKKCIHELEVRFLISQPKFTIKIVTADGTKKVTL